MFWIILGIFTLIMIVSFILDANSRDEPIMSLCSGAIFLLIISICLIALVPEYIDVKSVNKQIEIVETANQELEEEIAVSVQTYMNYEGKELSALKPDISSADLVAFAETYPELKSSQLVQEQITTYKENKEEIVKLKKDKVRKQIIMKFWLFKKYS